MQRAPGGGGREIESLAQVMTTPTQGDHQAGSEPLCLVGEHMQVLGGGRPESAWGPSVGLFLSRSLINR